LDDATTQGLQLGDKISLSEFERTRSEAWRHRVRKVSGNIFSPTGY
jgi:hypothetical protein